ncbi:MAG: hypothetical protein RIS88_648 [Pseudomonadota bacterium]
MTSIALVGLPGSGKTTIGKLLARRLGLDFVDSDQVIEERVGCPIRAFWEQQGEQAFRDIEEAALRDLTAQARGIVLATGGGSVLREANRQHLRAATRVVYLRSSPEQVLSRVRQNRNRPLLQVDDPLERLQALHAQREPLYRETAHIVVDTARPSLQALINMIVMQLELAGALPKP